MYLWRSLCTLYQVRVTVGDVNSSQLEDTHVPVEEFMYLVPGESYSRRLRSLLCLCDIFRALINSLVC